MLFMWKNFKHFLFLRPSDTFGPDLDWGSNRGGGEIFRTRPDGPSGPCNSRTMGSRPLSGG
jgi:hypothetical protein